MARLGRSQPFKPLIQKMRAYSMVYNKAKKEVLDGTTVLTTSTLKATLVLSTYVFNPDLQFLDDGSASDVQSNEAAGVTRQTLTNKAATEDDTGDFGTFTADPVIFPSVTTSQNLGGMVVYRDVGVDTVNVPVAFFPFSVTTDGRDVRVTFSAAASGGAVKAA